MRYYPIDENLSRLAHEANSFREYSAGETERDYMAAVDKAARIAEAQKRAVSPYYHDRIDWLLDNYSRLLAAWHNDYNRNRASCPSIMISGGSNFPVHKKERQNARESTLFAEYEEIEKIVDQIRSTGNGPVDLADPHAREILTERLQKLTAEQKLMKTANAYYRKTGTLIGLPGLSEESSARFQESFAAARRDFPYIKKPFPDYQLTSIREKIKRTAARIAQLDNLQQMPEEQQTEEADGVRLVRNVDLNRLQLIFDGKPDEQVLSILRGSGFRWSPKNGAWQRQLTDNAERAAAAVLEKIKNI